MSVARVMTIQKSRKDQGTCRSCGDPLPKGSGYRFWKMGFRSNYKHKVCLKDQCFPSPSSRESSKFATILAAQEVFEAQVDDLREPDEFEAAVADVHAAVEEVRDEYQEALDQWEHGNDQLQEMVDHYESAASELESWSLSNPDKPEPTDYTADDDGAEEYEKELEQWLEEARNEASEAVQGVEQG